MLIDNSFDWILFDIDDTLLDFQSASHLAFKDTLKNFNVKYSVDKYQTYNTINKLFWEDFEANKIDATTIRSERFNKFGEFYNIPLNGSEWNIVYFNFLVRNTVVDPLVVNLLEQLKVQRIKLGLITNGLKEVQRPRLKRLNLNRFFEFAVVSDEIGFSKPSEAFFQTAYDNMQEAEKERVLVIGDSFNADIIGASNFGFNSCWVNPTNKKPIEEKAISYSEIRSVLDLKINI